MNLVWNCGHTSTQYDGRRTLQLPSGIPLRHSNDFRLFARAVLRSPASFGARALIVVVIVAGSRSSEYTMHERLVGRKAQAQQTDRKLNATHQNDGFRRDKEC